MQLDQIAVDMLNMFVRSGCPAKRSQFIITLNLCIIIINETFYTLFSVNPLKCIENDTINVYKLVRTQ